MINSFGISEDATEESYRELFHNAYTAWEKFIELVKFLEGNGLAKSSAMYRLSVSSSFQPSAYEILISSAATAVSNLSFLGNLMLDCINGKREIVPLESIASISRVVLISSSRILYVLHPNDDEERKEHLREVQAANFYSEDVYLKKAQHFTVLQDYKEKKRPQNENPGKKITDTEMLNRAMSYVINHVYDLDAEPIKSELSKEKMIWMWNIWSGQAHGLYWPMKRPNRTGYISSETMPGEYPVDLELLTALTWRAIKVLRDACKFPASPQQ